MWSSAVFCVVFPKSLSFSSVSYLFVHHNGTHKLLINLPDSKNRFVQAPIKCRRWRPPSHLYIHSFCHRPASHQVSIPGERERILYDPCVAPLNYLLSDICWNSCHGQLTTTTKGKQQQQQQLRGSLHRLFNVVDPPSPCCKSWLLNSPLVVPAKRTNIFMFLTVYCVTP